MGRRMPRGAWRIGRDLGRRDLWRRLYLACFPLVVVVAWAACWDAVPDGTSPLARIAPLGAPPGAHLAGSGFVVGPGAVVTNAHVTMGCAAAGSPLLVAGAEGWRVARADPSRDLALLAGPALALPALRLSAAPSLAHGAPVMLLGYPAAGGGRLWAQAGVVDRAALTVHRPEAGRSVSFRLVDGDRGPADPKWEEGVSYFGSGNAGRLRWILEIAGSSARGQSGGPVADMAGAVVGVIFAGGRAGLTSAVTLADLRDFLLEAGLLPGFAPPSLGGAADGAAIEAAARSVVRVGC